jgi:hypothetical protein
MPGDKARELAAPSPSFLQEKKNQPIRNLPSGQVPSKYLQDIIHDVINRLSSSYSKINSERQEERWCLGIRSEANEKGVL